VNPSPSITELSIANGIAGIVLSAPEKLNSLDGINDSPPVAE
jgi:hypothetical protein